MACVSSPPPGAQRLAPAALIAIYACILLACLSVRPLWLDEVLQLVGARLPSVGELVRWLPASGGATPLGYLTQRPFVLAGGASAFWARLPSAIFSILACWALVWLCRELRIPGPATLAALAVFMIVPCQFRYAVEGRPYAEALFFCTVSSLALLKLVRHPSAGWLFGFGLSTAAAIYTQLYAILPACGLCGWAIWQTFRPSASPPPVSPPEALHSSEWRAPAAALLGLGCAVAAFLPWYLYAHRAWVADLQVSGFPEFHWTGALGLDAFKGLSGGSFLCSLSLAAVAAVGLSRARVGETRTILVCAAAAAIGGALATDAALNYFFATRQILFAAPALSIAAGLGFSACWRWRKLAALGLGAVLCAACLKNDIAIEREARENWPAAAKALEAVAVQGYCLDFASAQLGGSALYSVFIPQLGQHLCKALDQESKVAAVSHLYNSAAGIEATENKLRDLRFTPRYAASTGGTTIRLFARE